MCVFFRPVSAANLPDLINHLESVPSAEAYVYQLKDDQDRTMDCLKILSTTQGQYMGISHSFQDGIFSVRLSHSKNLIDWQFLVVLDQHASQPNIWLTENGAYIVAYEKMLLILAGSGYDFTQILRILDEQNFRRNAIFNGL